MPRVLKRSKETVSASLVLLLLLSSPGWQASALFAQTLTQAVSGNAGALTPVPAGIGVQLGGSAVQGLGTSLSLGGASVLPAVSAVQAVRLRSTALPRAAAAAGEIAPQAPADLAARPVSADAKAVFSAAPAAAKTGASSIQGLSKQVDAALESAGPLDKAPAESAHGLGAALMRLLTGAREKETSDSAPAPRGRTASKKAKAAGLEGPTAGLNAAQRQMIQTLDYVASIYTEHYAPIEWKQQQFGVDFKKEYDKVRAAVAAKPGMSFQEFQARLAAFVSSTRDYHVSIHFFSTEKARLPLSVMSAEGKYYLAYIDRQKLPETLFPYKVGDEVVQFDGKPVADAIAAIVQAQGPNVAGTDARLAEMRLTSRTRQVGQGVPQGPVSLKIRTGSGVEAVKLEWQYTPEMVPVDVPVRDGGLAPQSGIEGLPSRTPGERAQGRPVSRIRELLRKLIPSMAHPFAEMFKKHAAEQAGNRFLIGARESYVPKLGKVLWEIPKESPIYAYVFENEQGRKIGYIRIPDYMGEEQHAQIFAQIVQQFQKTTDGLVFDQVNNPGGSLFYMYALLSMLTDKPLVTPKHRLIIDESDAYWAAGVIQEAASQGLKKAFAQEVGKELGGYAPTRSVQESVLEYARFILSELKAGRRFTDFVSLFGIDTIAPSRVRYTKPILLLVNELDFSCADFFPAIMQDNGRAKLLGVRTAGAGGGVKSLEFPNQAGVAGFTYTWTIGQRTNGQPIENLGVKPDVDYQLKADDFRSGFAGYKKAINEALGAMLPPPAPVQSGPAAPADPGQEPVAAKK